MIRIDVLPDDVLLDIFDFYLHISFSLRNLKTLEAWQSLVHVCRRWRNIVFRSPRRLNLQLVCNPKTPVRDTLDVWPPLPLFISGNLHNFYSSSTDETIAALGQSHRVRQVNLHGIGDREFNKVLEAMQLPFPDLTGLSLFPGYETPPIVPDSFLGGSAPNLRMVHLNRVPFPGLPKLLLSATRLVHLIVSLTPDTFHPRQWPLSSPCCPASSHLTFDSNPLNLALTG